MAGAAAGRRADRLPAVPVRPVLPDRGRSGGTSRRQPPFEVVWLTPAYPWPGDDRSGIVHRTMARAMAAQGVRLRIVAPVPRVPPLLRRRSPVLGAAARAPRFQVDGEARVVRPRYFALPGEPAGLRPDWFIARAAMSTRAEWREALLVHAQVAPPIGMAARLVGAWTGLPYVLTIVGDDLDAWLARHPSGLPRLRAALRGAARVIATSDALVERCRELAGVEALSLPIGIDPAATADSIISAQEARHGLEIPEGRLVILSVARLTAESGIRELVDAILDLGPPFLALVAGDGPLAGYRAGEAAERDLVRYLGPRTGDDLAGDMAAADVLLLVTTADDPRSLVVDAGIRRLPVIAAEATGVAELLGRSRGTILRDRSAAGIALALRRHARSLEQARAAADRLHRHVRLTQDVGRNAGRLADVYREVIAGRLRGRG